MSLDEVQYQSDQNLLEFLRTELATCCTFLKVAETENEIGNQEHSKRSAADAEKAYATLPRFLADPKHAEHIKDEARRELTAGMKDLRLRLDKLPG